ncbi:MAG: DUF2442 domain-containing protein [Chloroflexi bacterium]|nr:MAG: DUF2442 domain-containing protein [Chloroflexota bacterium]
MLLAVVAVEVIGRYRVRLTFNDGVIKEIDFSKHWNKLFGPIFQPLRDPAFFAQVMLPRDSETIEWPNGADLAAEFLYEIGEPIPDPQQTMVAA